MRIIHDKLSFSKKKTSYVIMKKYKYKKKNSVNFQTQIQVLTMRGSNLYGFFKGKLTILNGVYECVPNTREICLNICLTEESDIFEH